MFLRTAAFRLRSSYSTVKHDPVSAFFSKNVQNDLKYVTGLDYEKVFSVKRVGNEIHPPTYEFLTEEELEAKRKRANRRGNYKLHMPPAMKIREPISKVMEVDPGLKGLNATKYVFTDITFGIHDRDRLIVVREPDGTLRTAEWDERDRLNQIYFPRTGRRIHPPPMFTPKNLEEILNPQKYEYILAKNCEQFEPDHPTFIQTAESVYEHADRHREYDALLSTRFYGPMVFTLVLKKQCDNLLVHYFVKKDLSGAAAIVRVYAETHDEMELKEIKDQDENMVRLYANKFAVEKNKVTSALETMFELFRREAETLQTKIKAHGGDSVSDP